MQRLVVVDNWSGKFVINEMYRPIAEALVKKFPNDLRFIAVQTILFVDNTESEGKTKNKRKYVVPSVISDKWHQILYQLTGHRYNYILEFYKMNTENLSKEQLIACIYSALRKGDMDPQIKELLIYMQQILDARNENYHMIEVLTKRNELLEELYSELHKELLELEKYVK